MSTNRPIFAMCPNIIKDFSQPGALIRYVCRQDGCPIAFRPVTSDVRIGDPRCLMSNPLYRGPYSSP